MTGRFVIWRPGLQTDGICRIMRVEGVEDAFELTEGTSRAEGWPAEAVCRMDPDYPKDIELVDCLYGAGVLVIASRVRDVLARAGARSVELLPVRVINHKGRTASTDYVIASPQDICDCIDVDRSIVEWNDIDPDSIVGCESLVLKEDAVPPGHLIFRPEHWRKIVIIRRELAAAMISAGLSGLHLMEPHDYNGLV